MSIEHEFGVPIPGRELPSEQWTRTAFKRFPAPEAAPLDWQAVFGRRAPVIVDLGCGNGRYILQSALARRECDHFGCDLLAAAIRYATRRANRRGLQNVRFALKDAQSLVGEWIAPKSVIEIHCYHPQPYHESKDRWRRLLTPAFLAAAHRALAPGGLFVVQTDAPAYGQYLKETLPAFFTFREQRGPWPDAPQGRTRREILALKRGYEIFRGSGIRLDLSDAEASARAEQLPLPNFKTRGVGAELDVEEAED